MDGWSGEWVDGWSSMTFGTGGQCHSEKTNGVGLYRRNLLGPNFQKVVSFEIEGFFGPWFLSLVLDS